MALDYDIDLKVSLETETEYQSLYKWCLKETKEDGKQVGRDLIPFRWTTLFHSTSFGIQRSISSESTFRFNEEEIETLSFTKEDVIFAKLESGYYDDDSWRAPSIAMFGSSRTINEINLRVKRIDDVDHETCRVWGCVAYDCEIDFRNERTEDTLEIVFYLESEKFDSLFKLIAKNEIDRLSLRLKDVEGFYSDWSPSASADSIKVLADMNDQGLDVDEEWEKRIPTLGKVGEASLTVQRTLEAKTAERIDDYADDWGDETGDSKTKLMTPARSQVELRRNFYERSLSRISKLLGILIVIELVKSFAN